MQYIYQVIPTDKNVHVPVVDFQSPRQDTSAGGEPWRAAETEDGWVYEPKSDLNSHLKGRGK